jgi:hypothetical protein
MGLWRVDDSVFQGFLMMMLMITTNLKMKFSVPQHHIMETYRFAEIMLTYPYPALNVSDQLQSVRPSLGKEPTVPAG